MKPGLLLAISLLLLIVWVGSFTMFHLAGVLVHLLLLLAVLFLAAHLVRDTGTI
jgi:membrane protein YdbS with pleckstrin-like domain